MTVEKLITDHIDTWTTALQTRSTAGRGSSGKIDLYGIKKLRELILELAVRGKLVPQDPNDEPASELLKRIAAEKAELVKQGKIKKQKPLPEISEEEKPFELPEGWEWVRLPDITLYKVGKTPSTKDSTFWSNSDEGIPWVSISDLIPNGNLDITTKFISKKASKTIFKYPPIPAGTILMSFKLTVGKTSLLCNDAYHNEAIISISELSGIDKRYLFHILPLIAQQGKTKQAIMGNTLNSESLSMLLIPVPNSNEQIKIRKKYEELLHFCDQLEQHSLASLDAHQQLVETLLATLTDSQNAAELADNWTRIREHFDTLFTTEASIEALKQTILQLAVMGKLAPQDPNDEPASVLLKRIAQEKEQLIKDGKIKKQKTLPPISDNEKPFELPEGWEWCRIDDIAIVSGGIQKQPKRKPIKNHFPYLRVANVQREEIKIDELERFELEPHELEFWSLKKDDLLIVEGNGSADEIGRCAIWTAPIDNCVYQNHLIRIRKVFDGYHQFISLFLNSPSGIREMQRLAVTTSGLYNLSVGKIRNIFIPLPPINEQKVILSALSKYISLCNDFKIIINLAQQTQLHLADALTDSAIN